jgi:hypothetical protein
MDLPDWGVAKARPFLFLVRYYCNKVFAWQ